MKRIRAAARACYIDPMRVPIAFLSALLAAVVMTGCGGGHPCGVEHVEETLAAYREDPSPAAAADVEAAFARLDAEIASLRAEALREDEDDREEIDARVAELEARRSALRRESIDAGMHAAGAAASDALRTIGESLGKQLEEAGRKLREAASGAPPPSN